MRRRPSAIHRTRHPLTGPYAAPAPAAGACAISTCPVLLRSPVIPRHSAATMNSVRPVRPAQRAGKAAAIENDRLENLAAFANPNAAFIGHVGVPNCAFGVERDAIRNAVAEIGPDAPVREAAVSADVEGGELLAIRFGDDQRRIVGRDR